MKINLNIAVVLYPIVCTPGGTTSASNVSTKEVPMTHDSKTKTNWHKSMHCSKEESKRPSVVLILNSYCSENDEFAMHLR